MLKDEIVGLGAEDVGPADKGSGSESLVPMVNSSEDREVWFFRNVSLVMEGFLPLRSRYFQIVDVDAV